jgi:hypothetical protein
MRLVRDFLIEVALECESYTEIAQQRAPADRSVQEFFSEKEALAERDLNRSDGSLECQTGTDPMAKIGYTYGGGRPPNRAEIVASEEMRFEKDSHGAVIPVFKTRHEKLPTPAVVLPKPEKAVLPPE